jgi:small nuclear ribonucleoprotein (snRNP)-like protein
MKASFLVMIFAGLLAIQAFPDVIRLKDGTIYLGQVTTASDEGVVLAALGKTIRIPTSEISKTETDLEALRNQALELALKDGSVIRGKVKDYDGEIGLFVDLEFGEITIPPESLGSIQDPVQRSRSRGYPIQAGISAGYYQPVGSLGSSFGSNFSISAFAEFNLKIVRGLYAGVDFSHLFLTYKPDADLSYGISALTAGPIYRLLLLRTSNLPFIKDLVPWAGLSAGVAYVAVRDRAAATSNGEMDPVFGASLGLDYHVWARLLVRLSGRWLLLPQSASAFHLLAGGLGLAYSF